MVSKESGKALFKTIMSHTWDTLWGEVTRGDCTSGWWRMDLIMLGGGNCQSGVPNGLGSRGIRCLGWRNGPEMYRIAFACHDSCSADGLVMTWFFCIFSAGGLGKAGNQCLFTLVENTGLPLAMVVIWGLLLVWDPSILQIWSWKVTCLAVFLLLLGVWTATWSSGCVAAKLGTWNWTIPNLSKVA